MFYDKDPSNDGTLLPIFFIKYHKFGPHPANHVMFGDGVPTAKEVILSIKRYT